MNNLESTTTVSPTVPRWLKATLFMLLLVGGLSVLTPTKQNFNDQIITPYINGLRSELKNSSVGIRGLFRLMFPALSDAGKELSQAYWEEVAEKVNNKTSAQSFLFMTTFRTTWGWGYTSCETQSFGVAGMIWVTDPDTCQIDAYRKKGGH